jgi:Fe-S-cluster containining protein
MICPFCDLAKEKDKCRIYEVRPRVCRTYICSKKVDKKFPKMYKLRNLWMELGDLKNVQVKKSMDGIGGYKK